MRTLIGNRTGRRRDLCFDPLERRDIVSSLLVGDWTQTKEASHSPPANSQTVLASQNLNAQPNQIDRGFTVVLASSSNITSSGTVPSQKGTTVQYSLASMQTRSVQARAGLLGNVVHIPHNAISISSPRNDSQLAGQTVAGAGAGPSAMSSAVNGPLAGSSSYGAAISGSSPGAPAVIDSTPGIVDSDGTRAMVMAPVAMNSDASAASVRPLDGSGSPQPQQTQPATLEWSGGAAGGPALIEGTTSGAPNGHYTASGPVPIGFLANLIAGGTPVNEPFNSSQWSGGTYNGYISTDYSASAPGTVAQPTAPVPVNLTEYIFATDGGARTYTVTFDAVNDVGTPYHADLTFTTVAPTQATITNPVGQNAPTGYSQSINGNLYYVLRLGQQATYQTQAGAGVNITATTQTNPQFGGEFAFIQTANVYDYFTATNGSSTYGFFRLIDANGGPNLDSQTGLLGYTIDGTFGGSPPTTGWTLPAGQGPVSHYMIDSPSNPQPIASLVNSSIGYAPTQAGGTSTQATPDKYVTYLMYKGDTYPTVWVALQKVSWQWTALATANAGGITTSNLTGPNAVVSSAIGQWPTWTGLLYNQTMQQYTPQN